MKVELSAKGTLCIMADSPVETFALQQWYTMYKEGNGHILIPGVRVDDNKYVDSSIYNIIENPISNTSNE